ncbi:MAG TPA: PAS domain S-box protein, partial [Dehalococcoidia bacterium]|nr:PAS domain S-box protein [Dehalococcoidia bacterium]
MKLSRLFPWLIVATAVLVAIATMVLVVVFRRQADSSRDELQTLLHVSSHVNTLSALEWEAMAEGGVTLEMQETAAAAGQNAESGLVSVAGGQPDGPEAALLQTYREYAGAVDQELNFVQGGRIEAAHAVDAETVDPLHTILKSAINQQIQQHESEVSDASFTSDLGVVVIIALGIGVVGSLLWSQEAMRRRAQLAVAASQKAEALQESDLRFRTMVENLNEIIYVQDTSGTLTYVSPAVRLVGGYEPEDIVGKGFSEFIHPEDAQMVAQSFLRSLSGQSEPLEYRALTVDGEVRWVRSSSRPIVENGEVAGLQGVLTDITDLKSAHEDLRRANSTLRAIVEASPLAIVAIDPDNHVTMWNQAAQHLFGWTPADVLGKPYPLVPEGEEAEYRVLLKKILTGGQFTGIETQRSRKDGTLIDVAISAAPLRDATGETVGALGVIADTTAKRRAEETIRHLAYHDPLTGLPNRALFTDRL